MKTSGQAPKINFEPYVSPKYIYVCERSCRRGRQGARIEQNEAHWKGTIAGTTLEYHAHTECRAAIQSSVDQDWDLELNRELQQLNGYFKNRTECYEPELPSDASTIKLDVIARYDVFLRWHLPWVTEQRDPDRFRSYRKDLARVMQIIASFREAEVAISTNSYFLEVLGGWLYRDLTHLYDYGPTQIQGVCRGGKLIRISYGKWTEDRYFITAALEAVPDQDREIWPAEQRSPTARAYIPIGPICVDILGCKGISRSKKS